MKLRRFRMKGKNDPDEFFAWCARKGLSREDLMLILASVELDTSVGALPTYLQDPICYRHVQSFRRFGAGRAPKRR